MTMRGGRGLRGLSIAVAVAAPSWLAVGIAHAQSRAPTDDPDARLARTAEVVVTATAPDGTLRTTPHGVTVITAQDIARSSAPSLGTLLGQEANLHLQSFFGTDRDATIDIRGMGATASSNVQIVVDGVRINEPDLSGADLAAIPLAQIERIEIVRGGGSVRWGNGAVGGVIQIFTKRGRVGAPQLDVRAGVASFATTETRIGIGGGAGPLSGRVTVNQFETDGYRVNGHVTATNVAGELTLSPGGRLDWLDVTLRAAVHRERAGLPGPVSAAAFAGTDAQRRASNAPNDAGEIDDRRTSLVANADLARFGQLQVQAGFRERDNPYVIGYTPLLSIEDQAAKITSRRREASARWTRDVTAFGFTHSLAIGAEAQRADYVRAENGSNVVGSSTRRPGEVGSDAAYATAVLRLPAELSLTTGLRHERIDVERSDQRLLAGDCTGSNTVFVPGVGVVVIPTGCVNRFREQSVTRGSSSHTGAELGLTWAPTRAFSAFASLTQHFRSPNVDELALASTTLRPQSGRTVEAGVRTTLRDDVDASLTLFRIAIDDEIFFGRDPITGASLNRNFERPTQRTGAETELRWRATGTLVLRTNAGYVQPRFDGLAGDIPLVPRVTANASAEWSPRDAVRLTFSVRHAGSRSDGNDSVQSPYPRLDAYTVCDAALRITEGRVQLTAGVLNLFDAVYSPLAFSNTFYPMPTRTVYANVRVGW
jgi:outer membrane cobalamin receptor